MEWFICISLLVVGLILIIKGGDWFVDAASWIAEVSGIPRFIIGATIVSLATTLPEILVSSIGAAEGNIGLAIGNAVGSVNANLGLILGLSIIAAPAIIDRKKNWPKSVILIVAVAMLFIFCMTGGDKETHTGTLVLWQAILVILVFVAFFIENFISIRKEAVASGEITKDRKLKFSNDPVELENGFTFKYDSQIGGNHKFLDPQKDPKTIAINMVKFVLGAAFIIGGALHLNKYGQQLAEMLGVPSDIIGVTIVAVGTSLPELATAITSIIKKKSDMSAGNVIGANIIDITLILPLCAFIGGGSLPVDAQTIVLDLPFCLAVSCFALIPALIFGKFKRWQGYIMMAGYVVYILLLVLNVPSVGVIHIF